MSNKPPAPPKPPSNPPAGGSGGTGPRDNRPPKREAWLDLRAAMSRLVDRCDASARASALRMVRRRTT